MSQQTCARVATLVSVLLVLPAVAIAQCFPPANLHQTTWEWVSSTGGVGGTRLTPASLGFTRQLIVDIDEGIWSYAVDEVLERQEHVTLTCGEVPTLGEVVIKVCDEGDRRCHDQAVTLSMHAPWHLRLIDIDVLDGFQHAFELRDPFVPVATARHRWTTVKALFDR